MVNIRTVMPALHRICLLPHPQLRLLDASHHHYLWRCACCTDMQPPIIQKHVHCSLDRAFKGYEEVKVPAVKPGAPPPGEELVKIEDMEEWAQLPFAGYK